MWAIFKREFKSFFITPMGYIFFALNLIISGIFFASTTYSQQSSDMSQYFGSISIILLFFVPILTMKLIAEDKHNKTDQLLFTSPVTPIRIVLGKYMAVCAVFLISQVISLLYLVILMILGNPNIINCLSMYLGFVIMGFAFISVGLFASSLTENQIVAAVIGFCILLCFWIVPIFIGQIDNAVLSSIVNWLSVTDRYEPFTTSLLSLSAIIYFITFAMLFLAFTIFRLSRINLRKITNFMLAIIVVVGLNLGVSLLSTKATLEYDMSKSGIYTLTKETKKVLADLKGDVTLYFFTTGGTVDNSNVDFIKIFDKYKQQSNKIKIIKANPDKNPMYARDFNNGNQISVGSIVVEYGKKYKFLSPDSNYMQQSNQTESIITNAIVNLTSGIVPNIAYLGGHGTELTSSSFNDIATYAQAKITSVNTLKQDISNRYDILIISAPKIDLNDTEISRIKKYVAGGGSLQVYYDVTTNLPRLSKYLRDNWGVTFNQNIVVESNSSKYLQYPVLFIPDKGDSDIVSSSTTPLYIPNARTLTISDKSGINPVELLTSSSTSYAKVNLHATTIAKEKGDIDGPAAIAYLFESGKGSLLACGSVSMVEKFPDYNYNFIVNTINYQSGNKNMQVRPKPIDQGTLKITGNQATWMTIILLFILPAAFIIASIVVYRKRRKM